MIEYFITTAEGTQKIDESAPGCWVNVTAPTPAEKEVLSTELGVVPEFIRSALDEEESPHTDRDDDTAQTMVIVDCAAREDERDMVDKTIVQYDTQPLSFIMLPARKIVITLSLHENSTVRHFIDKRLGSIDTRQRTRLLLQMLLHISSNTWSTCAASTASSPRTSASCTTPCAIPT